MAIWGSRGPSADRPVPQASEASPPKIEDQTIHDDVETADPVMRGYIDQIEPTGVTGWACDMRNLDASVVVEAVASDATITVVIADIFRQDVKDAGFGNGNHGFRIETPDMTGSLLIRFSETKTLITKDPIDLDSRGALLSTVMPQKYTDAMLLLAAKVKLAHAALVEGTL